MAYRSEFKQWQDEIKGNAPLIERIVGRHGEALSAAAITLAIVGAAVLAMVQP